MKKKIFFMTALIMLLGACALILAFNLTLNNYIAREAQKIIYDIQSSYSTKTPQESTESGPHIELKPPLTDEGFSLSPLQTEVLLLSKSYTVSDDYTYGTMSSSARENMLKYCRQHLKPDGEVHFLRIGRQEIYLSLSQLDNVNNRGGFMLVYVNVMPLKNFASTVNLVFFVILLLCGALSGYAGLRMGIKIENSQEKIKHFFENASHDLKTPLMSIQGYAEGLLTGVIKDQKKASQIILNESDKMNALVEEILFISKLESGKMAFRHDHFPINETLFDCLLSIEAAAAQKGLHIKIDIPHEPLMIIGDEAQLAKAVGNILSNALRYAASELRITCSCTKDASEVVLKLENDGPSIADAELPYLLDRFFTGERGRTGIGLSLAKEIVEQHAGRLLVSNTQNGVRFEIRLPLKK